MSDYENYEEYLFFGNTNRTESSCEMVDKIAELTKWLDLKSEYIVKIENENSKLKELLKEWLLFAEEENPKDFTVISERMQELAQQTNGLLGEQ